MESVEDDLPSSSMANQDLERRCRICGEIQQLATGGLGFKGETDGTAFPGHGGPLIYWK
jgi:hypothetical protein